MPKLPTVKVQKGSEIRVVCALPQDLRMYVTSGWRVISDSVYAQNLEKQMKAEAAEEAKAKAAAGSKEMPQVEETK